MLRAPRHLQAVPGRAVQHVRTTFRAPWTHTWLPKHPVMPKPGYITPEAVRLNTLRGDLWDRRARETIAQYDIGQEFVHNSKLRKYISKAREQPKIYYVFAFVTCGAVAVIWYRWRRDRKRTAGKREASLKRQLEMEAAEEAVVDKRMLRRPIVLVGRSKAQKLELLRKLVDGREEEFGFPLMHTTRKARAHEDEGERLWFAPLTALEQGIYSGAFLDNGEIRLGKKKFKYGLSKGAIADVRTAGRICLLDLDLAQAEEIAKTDLYPLVVLVSGSTAAAPSEGEEQSPAAAASGDLSTDEEWQKAVAAAKQKHWIHMEVSTAEDLDAILQEYGLQ